MSDPATERAALITRAVTMRAEIQSIFDDADHWNRVHPREEPINPDPGGLLRRIVDGIDKMLAAESKAYVDHAKS